MGDVANVVLLVFFTPNIKGLADYANPFFVNNFVVRTPLTPSSHMVILPRGVDLAWKII
jgi:hypothetical protein